MSGNGTIGSNPIVVVVLSIALFTLGTKSVLLVRLPFVLCGFGAAMLLYAFAERATGDPKRQPGEFGRDIERPAIVTGVLAPSVQRRADRLGH